VLSRQRAVVVNWQASVARRKAYLQRRDWNYDHEHHQSYTTTNDLDRNPKTEGRKDIQIVLKKRLKRRKKTESKEKNKENKRNEDYHNETNLYVVIFQKNMKSLFRSYFM
jgi:hypothetical protein